MILIDEQEMIGLGLIQAFGGASHIEDSTARRLYGAVRVTRLCKGTSDIRCLVISREPAS